MVARTGLVGFPGLCGADWLVRSLGGFGTFQVVSVARKTNNIEGVEVDYTP